MLQTAVTGYLLGSFPTAYLVGRWLRGIDIRQHGFLNMGALNALHLFGPFWGAVTFLCDAGKGAAAVGLARLWGGGDWAVVLCGLAAVAGHNWPVFLRFRGGKGAAAGIGTAFAAQGTTAALMALIIALATLLTRNVSFALGVGFAALPVINALWGTSLALVVLALGLNLLMALRLGSSAQELRQAAAGDWRRVVLYAVFGVPRQLRRGSGSHNPAA